MGMRVSKIYRRTIGTNQSHVLNTTGDAGLFHWRRDIHGDRRSPVFEHTARFSFSNSDLHHQADQRRHISAVSCLGGHTNYIVSVEVNGG